MWTAEQFMCKSSSSLTDKMEAQDVTWLLHAPGKLKPIHVCCNRWGHEWIFCSPSYIQACSGVWPERCDLQTFEKHVRNFVKPQAHTQHWNLKDKTHTWSQQVAPCIVRYFGGNDHVFKNMLRQRLNGSRKLMYQCYSSIHMDLIGLWSRRPPVTRSYKMDKVAHGPWPISGSKVIHRWSCT